MRRTRHRQQKDKRGPVVKILVSIDSSAPFEQVEESGADLVVLGSHGRHGIERLLLGSVSECVALHAPCSVESFAISLQGNN